MKKYFLAGLVTLLPLALTIMLFTYLIDLFTEPFLQAVQTAIENQHIPFLPEKVIVVLSRFLILIGLFFAIVILGVIARWFFFNTLISLTQKIFLKIPVVKSIYTLTKEIAGAFFAEGGRKAFQYPAQISFPSKSSECVGFVTGKPLPEAQKISDKPLVPVFIPTAPHPISGYMVLIPEDEVKKVAMTSEEAIKLTVSCGVIIPGENQ
jgi:uncharacterized membrane protein